MSNVPFEWMKDMEVTQDDTIRWVTVKIKPPQPSPLQVFERLYQALKEKGMPDGSALWFDGSSSSGFTLKFHWSR